MRPAEGKALALGAVERGSSVMTGGRRLQGHGRRKDTLRRCIQHKEEASASGLAGAEDFSVVCIGRRGSSVVSVKRRLRRCVVWWEERLPRRARWEERLCWRTCWEEAPPARLVGGGYGVKSSGGRRGSGVTPGGRRLRRHVVQREERLGPRA